MRVSHPLAVAVRNKQGRRRSAAQLAAGVAAAGLGLVGHPWGGQATALGQTFVFDPSGTPTAGSDGSGFWDNTTKDWFNLSNGAVNPQPYVSSTATVADFGSGATAGVVTLDGAVTVNTINFNAAGYSLANSGSGSLTFAGTNPTINTGGYNVSFGLGANTLALTGGSSIYKTSVGTLTFVNSQNGTGGLPSGITWNVSGGSLNTSTGIYNSAIAIADGTELGVSTNNVLTLNGGSLVFTANGGNGYASARTINVTNLGGAISDGGFAPGKGTAGGNTISPTINVAAGNGLNLVTSNMLEFDAGTITGAGGVTVYGTTSGGGTAELLSATNSYTGATTINSGTLIISTLANGGSNSSIGASSNAPANLVINGANGSANTLGAGATLVFTGTGTNSTDRGLTLEGGAQDNINVSTAGATLAFGGQVVGGGVESRLYKLGPGTLAFTGATTNALTGSGAFLNVAAGTLQLGATGQVDNVASDIRIGNLLTTTGANPTLNVVGGTVNIANANNGGLDLGNSIPSSAGAQTVTANLTGGVVNCENVYSALSCNGSVTAVLNMSGGAVVNDSGLFEANQTGVTGDTFTLNISGTGTAFNGSAGVSSLAYNTGTGTVNQAGGTVRVGTLFISGGGGTSAVASGTYNLGNGSSGSGTLNVGSVTVGSEGASSTATLNLNGGTLQANASSASFVTGLTAANVLVGGAVIDTRGFADTLSHPPLAASASPGGGLTVLSTGGGGTLTLTGSNTYTGGTTVGLGATLAINAPAALGSTGGNLSLTGTINLGGSNVTVGKLATTATTGSNGNAAGTVDFVIGSGGTVNTLSATSASLSGYTGIQLTPANGGSITPGTYTLISSAGGGLTGTVGFAGGENLTVQANQAIENIGGTNCRLTLAATGSAVTVNVAPAPAHTVNIMPLGSSITAGLSQAPYDGGGYRSQLYEDLVNDGRFTPQFQGSQTATEANGPTGTDLMTAVGQPNHEGHPGYTTSQILANLSAGAGYLAPGNGVNPDYVTLNIGGNDYANNPTDTGVIGRLAQIIDQVESLRPNATVVVSSVLYRGDNGGAAGLGIANLLDPLIPALVYQKVLAGEHVSFVDQYNVVTPGNSLAKIGYDSVHPIQAGYDLMANAWYSAITTGQAFYTGNVGASFNATGAGGTTSFAQDFQRTTDAGVVPSAGTDVYFNGGGAGGTVALGANLSVRSVNFAAGATTPITIAGGNTLTIGTGGITVQAGTAAHAIASAVTLGSAQEWGNVSASRFTVTGALGGAGPLTIGGTGVIALAGSNTYSGGTTVTGGTLQANTTGTASATGTGAVTVSAGGTLAGGSQTAGQISGTVAVSAGGTITAGTGATPSDSAGTLVSGAQMWAAGGNYVNKVTSSNGSTVTSSMSNDQLVMSGLTLVGTGKFNVSVTTAAGTTGPVGLPTGTGGGFIILAEDMQPAGSSNPFNATPTTLAAEFNLTTPGLTGASAGYQLNSLPVGGNNYDLILDAAGTAAAPEPTSLLLLGGAVAPLLLGRSRSRRRADRTVVD